MRLDPLRVSDATELAAVLDDPDLHTFIGGKPATIDELTNKYQRQVIGHSEDGGQLWFNWTVRRRDHGSAVGSVQGTVNLEAGVAVAEVAWVIATPYQRLGYAKEAAALMMEWLRHEGVSKVIAHIHPDHTASAAVARSLGLHATPVVVDGETRWSD